MKAKNDLYDFVKKICSIYENDTEFSVESARSIVNELNEFLYTTYDEIGMVEALGAEYQFISEFHRYWNEHYAEILDAKIDDARCEEVANAMFLVYETSDGQAFSGVYDTFGLSKEDICRIRMLTANQDFRGSRAFGDLVEIFNEDNSIFDIKVINDSPHDFLKKIGVGELSQTEKRLKYATEITNMLIEKSCTPYELIDCYDRDVYALRNALIAQTGAGYGNKKADMFVRDMVVLGVWEDVKNFDKINVASDINTIKVALRTGILKTEIPLVSSFLDIFCKQYSYIDDMTALAWRRVWEIFVKKYPETSIISPCLFDYYVYNVVGKQFCKENLYIFRGIECEHRFTWHSGGNTTCQICYKNERVKRPASVIKRLLPCESDEGKIAITRTDFYKKGICMPNVEECPFRDICRKNGSLHLRPPKSISILGRTGWTEAYANKGEGGGGLMA